MKNFTKTKIFITSFWLHSIIAAVILFTVAGCGGKPDGFQGYVEADMVYISPVLGGKLEKIFVDRGSFVKKGDKLFEQDSGEYTAAALEAEANLRKARSDLSDLEKGARPEEIEALKAKIARLEAICELAKIVHTRNSLLLEKNAISVKEFDTSRLLKIQNQWDMEESKHNLEVAKLPARSDQIVSAREAVKAAENELAQAKWRLNQRFVNATQNAFVFDVILRQGEYAAAGVPVVMLIPPENMKVRFFVPYGIAQKIHAGDKIEFHPDGSQERYKAKVSSISLRPEYTPPVIYSRDNNSKLVFMIEADIDAQDSYKVNPGLPVTVKLQNLEINEP